MSRDAFDLFGSRPRGRFGDDEAKPRNRHSSDERVTLTLKLHRDNPLSLTVSDPDKPHSRWVSLPKSEIDHRDLGHATVEVTLPEWLAAKEEL